MEAPFSFIALAQGARPRIKPGTYLAAGSHLATPNPDIKGIVQWKRGGLKVISIGTVCLAISF
jgi:hypothetical protein